MPPRQTLMMSFVLVRFARVVGRSRFRRRGVCLLLIGRIAAVLFRARGLFLFHYSSHAPVLSARFLPAHHHAAFATVEHVHGVVDLHRGLRCLVIFLHKFFAFLSIAALANFVEQRSGFVEVMLHVYSEIIEQTLLNRQRLCAVLSLSEKRWRKRR